MANRTRASWAGVLAVAAASVLTLGSPTLAQAAPAAAQADSGEEVVQTGQVAPGESQTVAFEDGTEMTVEVSEAELVTESDIRSDPNLTSTQRTELLGQVSARATTSAHWSQFQTGIAYTQTQNGIFYWNGSRVWVTQTYGGYTGSHRCFNNYSVAPWSVSNIGTSDSGSTSVRNLLLRVERLAARVDHDQLVDDGER